MKRAIASLAMPGLEPATALTERPGFRWVSPTTLLVDEAYQRNLSEKSVTLIRRIVADFDWRRFKPPIVVDTAAGLEVIDGQHTAIAAASHPGISEIPVMIVEAKEVADRARAFLGHNRDRLTVTPMQMHFAALAAKDPDACDIDQVCARAGIRVLRYPPGQGVFKARETLAIGSIGALIRNKGVMRARQILEVLSAAECAPIRAEAIRAATFLMTEKEYAGAFVDESLSLTIRTMGEDAYRQAKIFAAEHKVPAWRGLAVTWFRNVRKVRRHAA